MARQDVDQPARFNVGDCVKINKDCPRIRRHSISVGTIFTLIVHPRNKQTAHHFFFDNGDFAYRFAQHAHYAYPLGTDYVNLPQDCLDFADAFAVIESLPVGAYDDGISK